MHETVIAGSIIKLARSKARGKDVKKIVIEVGELAHLPAKELKATLRTMTPWKIIVREVRADSICKCGFKGRPKILERGHDYCLYVCPKCGAAPKLTAGSDIILKEVSI